MRGKAKRKKGRWKRTVAIGAAATLLSIAAVGHMKSEAARDTEGSYDEEEMAMPQIAMSARMGHKPGQQGLTQTPEK